MFCPSCGSNDILKILIKEKETEKDNFNAPNACCGTIIFGWPGLLCGLCGTGEREKSNEKEAYRCNNCGREWQ